MRIGGYSSKTSETADPTRHHQLVPMTRLRCEQARQYLAPCVAGDNSTCLRGNGELHGGTPDMEIWLGRGSEHGDCCDLLKAGKAENLTGCRPIVCRSRAHEFERSAGQRVRANPQCTSPRRFDRQGLVD